MFGFGWFVAAAAIVLVVIVGNIISGLRAKVRELEKERDKLGKLSVKNLVQLEVRWRNDCGAEETWRAVVMQSCCDSFLAEIREHLIWAKMRDEQWNLPSPFAWVRNTVVQSVHFYHLGNARWKDAPEIIDFDYSTCVWRRTSELVRSLAVELSPEKGAPLSAREFGMLIDYDMGWRLDNVRSWLDGGNAGYDQCADQLTNLRSALDEIARCWKYDKGTVISRLGRLKGMHPSPMEFVRTFLPSVEILVLELLKTTEGTKRVMDYILAESDLPQEQPKETASGTAS